MTFMRFHIEVVLFFDSLSYLLAVLYEASL